MYLLGILKIALGVPESTEGFRFGVELHVELPFTASSVQGTSGEDAGRVLGRGRGEELHQGFCGEG